ncbi:MAG: dihydroneopterin aldolase [Rhodospirillales bacterium]|nr:dihydroneopterin aldolase [Rhodospirillales bacterium]
MQTQIANSNASPAPAEGSYTKIIVKNLRLNMFIGVHDHEHDKEQAVIVSVELTVDDNPEWKKDSIDAVLNYESIVSGIKFIAKRGHINLLETYAGYIADFCLKEPQVRDVMVLVEKPDIFDFVDAMAVELYRIKG